MAILEQTDTGTRVMLRSRHLVGRSRLAHLQLREANISGEHAVLVWAGSAWEVHDLGSRNGTFVDGRRLDAGGRAVLDTGAKIAFGSNEHAWRLIDAGPPSAMAMPGVQGELRHAEGGFLALPDPDDPEVTIYRNRTGMWMLERDGGTENIVDGQEVMAGNQRFVLHLPELLAPTWDGMAQTPSIDAMTLRFAVSHDEEYVSVVAVHERGVIDLGARAHHYLLLTLARVRLRDRDAGVPESARGWMYLDELGAALGMDDKHLNVTVFRCRQQLGAAGVLGAANLIERRKPTRQIRLSTERVEITRE